MYLRFRPQFYLWELILFCRSLCMAVAVRVFSANPNIQVCTKYGWYSHSLYLSRVYSYSYCHCRWPPPPSSCQIFLALLVLMASLVVQAENTPYISSAVNRLENATCLSSLVGMGSWRLKLWFPVKRYWGNWSCLLVQPGDQLPLPPFTAWGIRWEASLLPNVFTITELTIMVILVLLVFISTFFLCVLAVYQGEMPVLGARMFQLMF